MFFYLSYVINLFLFCGTECAYLLVYALKASLQLFVYALELGSILMHLVTHLSAHALACMHLGVHACEFKWMQFEKFFKRIFLFKSY